jgi:hypothetical protein
MGRLLKKASARLLYSPETKDLELSEAYGTSVKEGDMFKSEREMK